MAAEVVAGSFLNALFNVLFDRMASQRFVDFFRRQKLNDRLLQKLKTSMNSVRGLLDDAEEKEITRPAVKQWLDDLKNVFFEADDLLDDIDYEATRLKFEAERQSAKDKVRKFLRPRKSFKNGLEARLMEILETVEDLVNQKDLLGLREIIGGGQSIQRIPTTCLVERSNIFGRERDQEAIMEVLVSHDINRGNNLGIISIVGLGGIGKTALAQLIYGDERVRNRFDVRGWVCVSEEFDVPRITRDILKELETQMPCDDKSLNQIQVELGKKLRGKRFLLVLDDVWNERFTDWDKLLSPLKSGCPGSKILVTTRNDGVAATVSFSSIFRLDVLPATECWQLFCKYAFDDQNSDDYPHLEEIGKEIVKRCNGLPLAVKVMGGVLRSKRNVKDWENVLRNDLWKLSKYDILPVLRLSYRYLPSHLKQCFAYCSIFPKDYEFEKKQLILLWMAEGFLIEQEGKETMEEVGEEYFEELVSRSFFQHVNNSFVMHDLINDLARAVAGDFCFRSENQDSCRTFDRLRYFSCVAVKEESSSPQLSSIFKSHLLRTFLSLYNTEWELQEMIPDLFLNQQRLKVLSLSRCQNVVKLSSSISHLEHLRYLDLSSTSIQSLPECLCSFYNLQTLKLSWCWRLAKLPTKMERMISMHYLYIQGTKLQEMPPNKGKLIKLQTLTDFFVGKQEGCRVKELGSLQHLGGTLRIHNLQKVVNVKDALEAKIKCKKNLKKLKLYWDGKTTLAQLIYGDERVRNRFDVRGWVCVSEEFDVSRITRDILKELETQMPCDDKSLNQIQVELGKILTGKKFLLVLDDVWNESFTDWDKLLTPLKSGCPGSKILVTTRNDGVAATVSFSSIFRLDVLTSTECWQLFCEHAFEDENCDDYPLLEEIGKEIVKRCDGLPLAVKVMGGVLRSKRNVKDWENVLKNDLWKFSKDGVLPVLRLSYRYLPSHLKQCFAYCSIFPKDYKFEKEQLILLWMAEGFLIEQEGNETIEEVGEEYFEELVSRSFFQHVNNYFVMHDLINDLARIVAGDFCFRFENQDFCRTLDRLRYFSCVAVKEGSSSRQLLSILKSHLLRTFLSVYNTKWELQEMIPELFLNQQRLRVLSLSRCQNVVMLPSSISHLEHLRYLDLSSTSIRSLPECLCSFHNLQTLKLSWCRNLAKLPTKMGRMISMHYLDIEGTNMQEMPPNMGKLIKLQTLTDFFVGKQEGCGVNELGSLQQLGGTLRIHNLQNVVNAKDALEAKIKCKKNLKELCLYWKGDTGDSCHEEAVLDGLQPHTEIEVISIIGYGGTSFANWLGESLFTKLVSLKLRRCKYCSSLPPLWQMSSLKYLEVEGLNEVRVIDFDFCEAGLPPSLLTLELYNLQNLRSVEGLCHLTSLEKLVIMNCPHLETVAEEGLPSSLSCLRIWWCPLLEKRYDRRRGIVGPKFHTFQIYRQSSSVD
ncbi:hypothetical protein K2173_007073 [Erythroxylum novogranatense]|uniref:Uncharacterized protein n=1 Tax=Erythroxylum novogranatense TaxID=1862640 RepID=A0AAV8SYA3_9ROSI|nr:hypothetical protein K2173_007073 [Erythroxylum novogranatense]